MPKSNVRRINGIEVTGTPAVGDVPTATSTTAATWGPASSVLTDAVILAPATSTRNLITPTVSGTIALQTSTSNANGIHSHASFESAIYGNSYHASEAAILGVGDWGPGVEGQSTDDAGVYGYSSDSFGVVGESYNSNSAIFVSASDANTEATVIIKKNGASTANLLGFATPAGSFMSWVDHLGQFHGSVSGSASALLSATTTIDVSAATAPTAGQVLTASSGTAATWQSPSNYASVSHAGALAHYATLALAKAAAASGDTILVYPGTYNERDLLKAGVNWYFFPGAKVYYTGSANGAIFDDSATGANGAVTCTIGGWGDFKNAGSGTGNNVFTIANASVITATGQRAWQPTASLYVVNQTAGTLDLTVDELKTEATAVAAYLNAAAGVQRIRAKVVNAASTGNTLRGDLGTQILVADDILDAMSFYCHGASQHVTFARYAQATGAGGAGRFYCDGGTQRVTGQSVAGGADTIAACAGGTQEVHLHDATTSGHALSCTGGEQVVEGGTYTSSGSAKYAVTGTGGTQRIKNVRAVNSDANGVAANAGGQTLIFEGACTVLSGASATDSLSAAAPQNVKVYGFLCGNKAKNANVTTQVGRDVFSDSNVV